MRAGGGDRGVGQLWRGQIEVGPLDARWVVDPKFGEAVLERPVGSCVKMPSEQEAGCLGERRGAAWAEGEESGQGWAPGPVACVGCHPWKVQGQGRQRRTWWAGSMKPLVDMRDQGPLL